jgi:1-acyl-sn-glycerol-3-phosphate acyltransferase
MRYPILNQAYRFIPPYTGTWWPRVLTFCLPFHTRRSWGLARVEFRGLEQLHQSLAAGHGVMLCANHPRRCDPAVLGMLSHRVRRPFFAMAAWPLFLEWGLLGRWVLRRLGAFSVFREGLDRSAVKTATQVLVEARRPLVVFPEGVVTRLNDRICTLLDGAAFIARAAGRQRAQATPAGRVVIHPVAIKYYFRNDIHAAAGAVLDEVETRLTWRKRPQQNLVDRIVHVGTALLSLKEMEILHRTQAGTLAERLAGLVEAILVPLEKEWLKQSVPASGAERIRRLRSAIVPDLTVRDLDEVDRARRWDQLADIQLAQQLLFYPSDYIRSRPTAERVLETVERFEEDLTGAARIHRPLHVVVQIGQALEVVLARERGKEEDPLMTQLHSRLQALVDELANDSTPLFPAGAESPAG